MLCSAVVGVGGYAAGIAHERKRAPDPVLVWHGETFYSKREFVGWLVQHGQNPKRWLQRHPSFEAQLASVKK